MYKAYKNLAQTSEEKESNYYKYEIIENMEHKNYILQNNRIVCIEIYGDWCMPCKEIRPRYAELAQKYNSNGEVCICAENFDLGLTPKCTVVPTFYIFHRGQLIKSIIGADLVKIENELLKLIDLVTPERDGYHRTSDISSIRNNTPTNKFQNFHGNAPRY